MLKFPIKTIRSLSQPSFSENTFIMESHQAQSEQLEAKYQNLVDQIYFMKKQNNRFSNEIIKIDQHLDNFKILQQQMEGDRQRAEKDYGFYERKIDDLMFKKKYIMKQKQKKIDEDLEKNNIDKQILEESVERKLNATHMNLHQLKEIQLLKQQKIFSINKMSNLENLSEVERLIHIMGQLFLKGGINLYIDSQNLINKEEFKQIIDNLDFSILFRIIPEPQIVIDNILKECDYENEFKDIEVLTNLLIEKYHSLNARQEQLFRHAELLITDLGSLKQIQPPLLYSSSMKTPISSTFEQLENDIFQISLENGQISTHIEKVTKLQVRLFSTIFQQAKRMIHLIAQIDSIRIQYTLLIQKEVTSISQTLQQIKELVSWMIFESKDLLNEVEELKDSVVEMSDKQKKQYQYFKEYLEQQKINIENSNNFVSIGQELFPHLTKKQQQAQILIFLKQIQKEQNDKLKQMQIKMSRQYEMSVPYKVELIINKLGKIDGSFRETLEKVLISPLVQLFLNITEVIRIAISSEQDPFKFLKMIDDETLQNYKIFHVKYFVLARELFQQLKTMKPMTVSWQSWKSEQKKLCELQERLRFYSYRSQKESDPKINSQQYAIKNLNDEGSSLLEQFEQNRPLNKFLFEKVKHINSLYLSYMFNQYFNQRTNNNKWQIKIKWIYGFSSKKEFFMSVFGEFSQTKNERVKKQEIFSKTWRNITSRSQSLNRQRKKRDHLYNSVQHFQK